MLNERLVLIVDGDKRLSDNPKAKNLKHLNVTNTVAEAIRETLNKGEIPDDQIIKNSLKMVKEARERNGKEV